MEQQPALSIEESIQRLKAEIIAQDWRLSPKRASQLEAAFDCLRQRFKTRKATHAMLVMAGSVLDHIKKKGGTPPDTIDFLKEAMAHIVSLYEELAYDPEKEELVFQRLFNRFNRLKEKIKHKKTSTPLTPPSKEEAPEQPQKSDEPIAIGPQETPLPQQASPSTIGSTDIEHLMADLKNTLEKAGEVGLAIGRVLEELLEKHSAQSSSKIAQPVLQSQPPEEFQAVPEELLKEKSTPAPKVQACPPAELKELVIHGKAVALVAEAASLIRPVKASKLSLYLKHSNIPLNDFSTLFQGLSCQFNGSLSQIPNQKLKKLNLPIMTPEGSDWPEPPDDTASTVVVVSNGNWHGIIPCSSVKDLKEPMVKFNKQKNGDIAGIGHLENGRQVELLDLQRILHREGFLVMV
nr:hypothetical protein [Desulfobulbaceae bacterium]